MKAATRILTLVGLSLMTGATLGAGPALAATSAPDVSDRTAVEQPRHDRAWVVGYYDTRRECERAGRVGEWRDRWDDYDCDMVWRGWRRGDWKLTAERDGRDWRNGPNRHDDDHDNGGHHRDRGDDDNRQR